MDNTYESEKLLGEYLLFHYGNPSQIMPWEFGPKNCFNFPIRTVTELLDLDSLEKRSNIKALDVGCSVGGSTFELSKYCDEVSGIDLSKSFINAAKKISDGESLQYKFLDEGDQFHSAKIKIDFDPKKKISFEVADACSLPAELNNYPVVHAANLICRLPDPRLFINRLPDLVSPGGQLLLATPFTWLNEFTPRGKWLGSGDSEEKLKHLLESHFDLEKRVDLPFIIREHKRKYQFSVSLGTRWRRKE